VLGVLVGVGIEACIGSGVISTKIVFEGLKVKSTADPF
jgi:hypothetical protein